MKNFGIFSGVIRDVQQMMPQRILLQKTCFQGGFDFLKNTSFKKKNMEQSQNKILYTKQLKNKICFDSLTRIIYDTIILELYHCAVIAEMPFSNQTFFEYFI